MHKQPHTAKKENIKLPKFPQKDITVVTGQHETDASDDHSSQQRLKLAAGLRDLADRVEQQPELMSRAADLMSQDFMDNRAPLPEVEPLFTNHLARHKCRSKLLYCLKCIWNVKRAAVYSLLGQVLWAYV